MKLSKICHLLLILCLLPISSPARPMHQEKIILHMTAQTITGTLLGTVIDPDNTPIKGALVRVVNTVNGFSYGRRTDEQGIYRIDFLPAGEYDITASMEGYIPNILPKFLVEVNREKIIKPPPIRLLPVSAPTPPPNQPQNSLQTNIADATLRGSATEEFLEALPLAGIRSFDTFALLVPGVAPPPATIGANGPGIGAGIGTAGQFSVNGQRARANNFTIDGSDNNDQDVGVRRQGFTPAIPQPLESIREFQITTLLADAEAGRNIGGQINVVSRSGANSPHGQLYNLFTDSSLNARDFFDLSVPGASDGKPAFTRNQFGAAGSFPIIKNRLIFFGALERQDLNRSQELNFSVPTFNQRESALNFGSKNFGSVSLLGRDVLDLYPLPNNVGGPYGANTFTNILPATGKGTIFTVKLDYQFQLFGKLSTLTGRYDFTDDNTRIAAVGDAINSSIEARTRAQNLAFSINTELSAFRSNQVRFSFGRTALSFGQVAGSPLVFQSRADAGDLTGDGLPDGRTGPIGQLAIAPFSSIGIDPFTFPQGRANNTFQIADTFIFTRGKHSVKFGGDIRRVQFNSFLDRNYRTQLSFNSGFFIPPTGSTFVGSGVDFAGFGTPNNIFQALAVTPDSHLGLRFDELNFFIQDSFRIHPRVNLEYGLRYELNTVPVDASNRLERELATSAADFQTAPGDIFAQTFFTILNAQRAILDGRDEIYSGDHNNFAPRVGIAWDIKGNGRTSLRAGYGLFYDQILGNIVSQSRNVFPSFIPLSLSGSPLSGIEIFPDKSAQNLAFFKLGANLVPLIQPGSINSLSIPANQLASVLGRFFDVNAFSLAFTLPEKNLRTPYVHQYSLTLEQALGDHYIVTASYVGTAGHKLLRLRTPNGGPNLPLAITVDAGPPDQLQLANPHPNSLLGAFTLFESSANANYNALQISFARRAYNGFGFQLAYTYAHAIDDVSDLFDLAGGPALAQDEVGNNGGLRAERGDANFDLRQRFTAGWQYELPKISWIKYLAGLQLSGILTLQTGQPFTVNTSLDENFDGNLTDRLNTTDGLIFSDSGRARIALAPNVSPLSLLAISTRNPQGGAVGRNTFRAAGLAALDLALTKNFSIKENHLSLRMEAFNLFNRVNFGIPARVLEAPAFGSAVTTALPARILQIVVRYSF
jgi:hypothetical protein